MPRPPRVLYTHANAATGLTKLLGTTRNLSKGNPRGVPLPPVFDDDPSGHPLPQRDNTVESTEGISEIWFCAPFPPWGVHKFGVMVRFTYD